MKYLVVGLGNPGSAYETTRHNIGFLCVKHLAEKMSASFRRIAQVSGQMASGVLLESQVYLLLPSTYMNNSGRAVSAALRYFQISLSHLLVVCDDIHLPFGSLRIRAEGSAGGHNGLKSIEAQLATRAYARLRVGVGDREEGDLADYVLGEFLSEEKKELPHIIENATAQIEQWLKLTGE